MNNNSDVPSQVRERLEEIRGMGEEWFPVVGEFPHIHACRISSSIGEPLSIVTDSGETLPDHPIVMTDKEVLEEFPRAARDYLSSSLSIIFSPDLP